MSVLINGMEMPTVCEDCRFYDTNYDYPTCLVNNHSRGYNFNGFEHRMSDCPLKEVIMCKDCNEYQYNFHWCKMNDGQFEPTDYCNYAERRM